MFTGIIESTGKIKKVSRTELSVGVPPGWALEKGESVAVNGACLTALYSQKGLTVFSVSPETFKKTNFSLLKAGGLVNLERAMKADGRFSGHFVTGHIDGLARLISIKKEGNSRVFEFCAKTENLMVEKGSVALNGISLTVYEVKKNSFKVSVIGHSWENTNLKFLKPGASLNIEYDILGKYVAPKNNSGITMEFLKENGFV